MPALRNPRRERFARHYYKLGIGRHAYRAAGYSAEGDHVADANASRLIRCDEVQRRLREIADMTDKVTEATLLAELEEARQGALEAQQHGPAVQATMGKARITGHIVDRKEVGKPGDFENMDEQQLRAFIAKHMAASHAPGVIDHEPSYASRDIAQTALAIADSKQDGECELSVVENAPSPVDAADVPAPTHKAPRSAQ